MLPAVCHIWNNNVVFYQDRVHVYCSHHTVRPVATFRYEEQDLIDCWAQLSQDTLNRSIAQVPKRLTLIIKAKGGLVECSLD